VGFLVFLYLFVLWRLTLTLEAVVADR